VLALPHCQFAVCALPCSTAKLLRVLLVQRGAWLPVAYNGLSMYAQVNDGHLCLCKDTGTPDSIFIAAPPLLRYRLCMQNSLN
jgi:hypothetical protein